MKSDGFQSESIENGTEARAGTAVDPISPSSMLGSSIESKLNGSSPESRFELQSPRRRSGIDSIAIGSSFSCGDHFGEEESRQDPDHDLPLRQEGKKDGAPERNDSKFQEPSITEGNESPRDSLTSIVLQGRDSGFGRSSGEPGDGRNGHGVPSSRFWERSSDSDDESGSDKEQSDANSTWESLQSNDNGSDNSDSDDDESDDKVRVCNFIAAGRWRRVNHLGGMDPKDEEIQLKNQVTGLEAKLEGQQEAFGVILQDIEVAKLPVVGCIDEFLQDFYSSGSNQLNEAGRGSFGIVYLVDGTLDGQPVALKISFVGGETPEEFKTRKERHMREVLIHSSLPPNMHLVGYKFVMEGRGSRQVVPATIKTPAPKAKTSQSSDCKTPAPTGETSFCRDGLENMNRLVRKIELEFSEAPNGDLNLLSPSSEQSPNSIVAGVSPKSKDNPAYGARIIIALEYCNKGNMFKYLGNLRKKPRCLLLTNCWILPSNAFVLFNTCMIMRSSILTSKDDGYLTVKISDFGLSRKFDDKALKEGRMEGTARYSSPEQQGCKPLGTPSDVYSLGITMIDIFFLPLGVTKNEMGKIFDELKVSKTDVPPQSWQDRLRYFTGHTELFKLIKGMIQQKPDDRCSLEEVSAEMHNLFEMEIDAIRREDAIMALYRSYLFGNFPMLPNH